MYPATIAVAERLLFRFCRFPQVRCVHNVAKDPHSSFPTVFRRFPGFAFYRAERCNGPAAAGDGNGISGLFNLGEACEALGFELGRAEDSLFHTLIRIAEYGHLTNSPRAILTLNKEGRSCGRKKRSAAVVRLVPREPAGRIYSFDGAYILPSVIRAPILIAHPHLVFQNASDQP